MAAVVRSAAGARRGHGAGQQLQRGGHRRHRAELAWGSLLLSTVIIFITELTQLLLHPVHGVQLTLARHHHEILHLQQVLQIKYTFLHWNDIIQFYTKIITFISQRLARLDKNNQNR